MEYVEQDVRLRDVRDRWAEPEVVANAIRNVPLAARAAATMAVEGAGQHVGRPSKAVVQIGDLRFAAAEPDKGDLLLRFMGPRLGEAAPGLYDQGDFWKRLPDPDSTALDLLVETISAVDAFDRESDRYDQFVLKRLKALRPVLGGAEALDFESRRFGGETTVLDEKSFRRLEQLQRSTPEPVQVRLTGRLDMIRASTHAFGLLMDDGNEVLGVYQGDPGDLLNHFQGRVLAIGRLHYRPSGSPLRLDAEFLSSAEGQSAIWAKIPSSRALALEPTAFRRRQGPGTGVSAIMGAWPGDEDDDTVARELSNLS